MYEIFQGFTPEEKSKIKLIISDVDDTITSKGALLPCVLDSMYKVVEKGYKIILLTGGSAGWADVYMRQWPVFMSIAESGAVLLYNDSGLKYEKNPKITDEDLLKREKLLSYIDKSYLSSDQYARLYDIAIDLKKISTEELDRIENLAKRMGANTSKSSIHLNIFFGPYDKKLGLIDFMKICDIDEELLKECSIYLGDAKNDEVLFNFFPTSIGMKSVLDNKDQFKYLPKYISPYYGGKGFSETLNKLL